MNEDTKTEQNLTETLKNRGYSIQSGNLRAEVRNEDSNPWPCITFDCVISKGENKVWNGPYSLGVGHVKILKPLGLPMEFEAIFYTLQNKPNAQFKDKMLHARLATFLAKYQKVSPSLADVLYSILIDGSPYFDNETFEDWCANFGYDVDSRKAERMYRVCDDTGRQMVKALGREEIEKLRELFADY
jgi:hypothetical protein